MSLRAISAFSVLASAFLLLQGCSDGGPDEPDPPVNRPPVLSTTSLATTEDTILNAQLAATDPDNNSLTFTRVNDVQNGTLTLTTAGAVTYTPNANYSGSDSFSVSVSDGAGGTVTGTVTLNVAAVNDAPTFTGANTLATNEDVTVNHQLTATDVEANPLTYSLATGAQHGTVTVTAAGAVTYAPAANYAGPDSFSASVSDGAGGQTTTAFNVTVAAVNDAPVFTSANTLATNEDVTANHQLTAADPDANSLVYSLVTGVQHGSITLTAAGAVTYAPAANYSGMDSFAARVSDGAGGEATLVVNITVAAVNDAPSIGNTQFAVSEDGQLNAQLTATDVEGQTVQFSASGGASHGIATISPTGQVMYIPDQDYSGNDTFVVDLTDGVTAASATLTITVTPVNDAPQAVDDELRVPAAATIAFTVLSNDSDVDGDALSVSVLTPPSGGTLAVNASNQLVFTRDNAFNGPISFTYRITDTAGVTDDATVRAVIGEFTGLYYISDETTLGRAELHFFDGLHVTRVSGDLAADQRVSAFSVSDDGSNLAYVVEAPNFDRVYFVDSGTSGGRLVYTAAPKTQFVGPTTIELNRSGDYLRVYDPERDRAISWIVRTSDGLTTRMNGSGVVQGGYFAFSPAEGDNAFYSQIQVGGSPPPMSGTGYLTLFSGNLATPGAMTQAGLTYPTPSLGGGSGINVAVTADGRYVIHEETLFSPMRTSVLVYDSMTQVEAPIYRRPVAGEIGMWGGFAISNDGRRVCFQFRDPGSGSFGPSRFIVGDPGLPSSAVPVTPTTSGGYTCQFGSDNRTMFFLAQFGSATNLQLYSVDSVSPLAPVLVNQPFTGSQYLDGHWIARDAMRVVFGARGISAQVNFISVSLDDPTRFIPFATNTFDDGSLPAKIDSDGFMFAYSKRPTPGSGLRRLTLLSTQSPNYVLPLTRADTTTGLLQFEWAP